jgi:hypothetical protein
LMSVARSPSAWSTGTSYLSYFDCGEALKGSLAHSSHSSRNRLASYNSLHEKKIWKNEMMGHQNNHLEKKKKSNSNLPIARGPVEIPPEWLLQIETLYWWSMEQGGWYLEQTFRNPFQSKSCWSNKVVGRKVK